MSGRLLTTLPERGFQMNVEIFREEAAVARYDLRKAVQAAAKSQPGDGRERANAAVNEIGAEYRAARERLELAVAASQRPDEFVIGVRSEPATYRRGGEHSLLKDLRKAGLGDGSARERLERHARETVDRFGLTAHEARVVTEAAGKGEALVAPAFLQRDLVALARAGRPFVEAVAKKPLPASGDLRIPLIKSGAEAEVEAEAATIEEIDPTTEEIESHVTTIAGTYKASRQLYDRAAPELADDVFGPDLLAAYLVKCDKQALSGTGEGNQLKGVLSESFGANEVAFTSATPKITEFYKAVAAAIKGVWEGVFLPPTHIFMSARRWAWLIEAADESGRPLVEPAAWPDEVADADDEGTQTMPAGSLLGLQVVIDESLPRKEGEGKNQDVVIIARSPELWWHEDLAAPIRIQVADDIKESDEGMVRLTASGYAGAFMDRRPKAISIIGGTGLVEP
jgi:HK97 family phage major capsid protein